MPAARALSRGDSEFRLRYVVLVGTNDLAKQTARRPATMDERHAPSHQKLDKINKIFKIDKITIIQSSDLYRNGLRVKGSNLVNLKIL
jgi:hypothetical protein